MPLEKEKAPGASPTPQSRPAKVRTVDGKPTPLCARDKKILRRVRAEVSRTLDALDEIENNVARDERPFLIVNLQGLLLSVCAFSRLPKPLSGTVYRAKALEARS